MTNSPKRVWLDQDAKAGDGHFTRCFEDPKYCSEPAIQYVRADRVDALENALQEAIAAIENYATYDDADPWRAEARLTRDMDIDHYAADGRLEAARVLLGFNSAVERTNP